jgi:UDP-glucose 4-epimerase
MKQTVLVIGGAGYIGSHTAYLLSQQYTVIVLDTLVHGQSFTHPWATFIHGDYGDRVLLEQLFSRYQITYVMHFAAYIEVGQSVTEPLRFYHNNVANTITLLHTMRTHNCTTLIFSSSCAVYGTPHYIPIDEQHPRTPISPYGHTKLMVEQILHDCATAYGLQYVALRYFNAAGGLPAQKLYEQHTPETHLIPLLIRACYERTPFALFGADYPTADGSCIRDFLHVLDIAQAHIHAIEYLAKGNESTAFNLGTGQGISVRQMIQTVEKIIGSPIMVIEKNRRAGDPACLVADASKAYSLLAWHPQRSKVDTLIDSAIATHLIRDEKQLQSATVPC